jgi:hypothetical protein
MNKLYYRLTLAVLVLLSLNSCRKNEFDGLELKEHPYEEWSKLAPFDVSASGSGNNAFISWVFKPEYEDLMPSDVTYEILFYKGGSLRAKLPSHRVSFSENTPFAASASYSLSILYSDGNESPRTSAVTP